MAECTNYQTGTITLSSSTATISISGLDFIPTNAMIIVVSAISTPSNDGGTFGYYDSNKFVSAYYNSSDGFYCGANAGTVLFGTTSTFKPDSDWGDWKAGTYRYIVWREE